MIFLSFVESSFTQICFFLRVVKTNCLKSFSLNTDKFSPKYLIPYLPQVFRQSSLVKQYRPRPDTAECLKFKAHGKEI